MKAWTEADIRELPAVISIVTAGEILGIGRTKSYQLAKTGAFPVEVRRVDGRYKVPTIAIHTYLGINKESDNTA
ncbi:DNA-binding protein [Frankia sp. AgKG'84/4]|uniref:DNA-binding protein n=1 Tax=Frankia sp. AgKG'84/4 TaxID=573490 RepID=UPI002029E8E6|nr:DNA-binding protein [Frankia sp. AgKG'84/4]MCL9793796.1 DNA-binding protein [Frankia sp. AgKG'84/4]